MKVSLAWLDLRLVILVYMSISGAAYAQQVDCGVSGNLDGGVCGCPYGYNDDGTCAAYYSGGCSDSDFYLYTDLSANSDGSVSFWSMSTDTDGNAGEGTLTASVSGTMPDGTPIPRADASSSNSSTVEADQSISVSSYSDNGNGDLDGDGTIQWDCGMSSVASFRGKIGYSQRTFMYSSVSNGVCTYLLNCPPGQTPTCKTNKFEKAAPCYETYINDTSIYILYGSTLQCFGIGSAPPGYIQGVCN